MFALQRAVQLIRVLQPRISCHVQEQMDCECVVSLANINSCLKHFSVYLGNEKLATFLERFQFSTWLLVSGVCEKAIDESSSSFNGNRTCLQLSLTDYA